MTLLTILFLRNKMNEERREIYAVTPERNYELQMKKLDEANLSMENKGNIKEYLNVLFSKDCSLKRIVKMSYQLRNICSYLLECGIGKSLKEINKNDLIQLLSKINQLPLKPITKADYRKAIKQYFRWFEDDDLLNIVDPLKFKERKLFYKFLKEDVKRTYKSIGIDSESILKKEDIEEILSKCKTYREKAIISVLHESGFRIEEFLNIKLKHIQFHKNFVEIIVNGKTGKREIPLSDSMGYLFKYVKELHPHKEDKESYLWLSECSRRKNEPLKYRGMCKLIKRCVERTEIKKKKNPHWFRHSRATILAPKLTEVMLCKYMGWVRGSEQVKTYVHLCKDQLIDSYLEIKGIKRKEEVKEEKFQCKRCGFITSSQKRYCDVCNHPTDISIVLEDDELKKSAIDETMTFFMEMMKNPEMMKRFTEFKEKMVTIK